MIVLEGTSQTQGLASTRTPEDDISADFVVSSETADTMRLLPMEFPLSHQPQEDQEGATRQCFSGDVAMRTTETPKQDNPLRTVQRMLLQPPTSNAEHLAESCLGRLEASFSSTSASTKSRLRIFLDLKGRQPPLNPLCGVLWSCLCCSVFV